MGHTTVVSQDTLSTPEEVIKADRVSAVSMHEWLLNVGCKHSACPCAYSLEYFFRSAVHSIYTWSKVGHALPSGMGALDIDAALTSVKGRKSNFCVHW